MFAPAAHVWYNKVLDPMIPGTSTKAVVSKMLADQTVWTAVVNGVFLTYSTLAQGVSAVTLLRAEIACCDN